MKYNLIAVERVKENSKEIDGVGYKRLSKALTMLKVFQCHTEPSIECFEKIAQTKVEVRSQNVIDWGNYFEGFYVKFRDYSRCHLSFVANVLSL